MIVFKAPLDYRTGYGINSCRKMLGLLERGHEIFVRASEFIDHESSPIPIELYKRRIFTTSRSTWEVAITSPMFLVPTEGKKTVFITTFETDSPPPNFMKITAPKLEAIIVPCRWNRDTLVNAGFKGSIFILPETVDEQFRFSPLPTRDKRFSFAAVCCPRRKDGDRKGVAQLVRSFINAFPDDEDVELKIKVPHHKIEIPNIPEDPRVIFIREDWPVHRLAEFYRQCDCYITTSCGEAWGRTLHEAMATGRPCIAPKTGGHADFFDGACGWELKTEVHQGRGNYDFGKWMVPLDDSVVEAMREAKATPREKLAALGLEAHNLVSGITPERATERLEEILIKLGVMKPLVGVTKRFPKGPEEMIRAHYEDRIAIPRRPLPNIPAKCSLTNEPTGIGDAMILTPVGKAWHDAGIENKVWSGSKVWQDFVANVAYNTSIRRENRAFSAWRMMQYNDTGAGHVIQRLLRAFGLPVPLAPRPILKANEVTKDPGSVAIHLEAGKHADWQKRTIHPRAREVYHQNVEVINKFIKARGLRAVQVGSGPKVANALQMPGLTLDAAMHVINQCEYFIGIMSGPMHIATAMGCKCIVIINFPDPELIYLPTMKDIPQVEAEWFYPQHVHLHQDKEGPLVPMFSETNLAMAWDGLVYPFWSDRYLHLGLSEHERSELH